MNLRDEAILAHSRSHASAFASQVAKLLRKEFRRLVKAVQKESTQ